MVDLDNTPKYPDCAVQLTGNDGNAFAILGAVSKALKRHLRSEGASTTEIGDEVKLCMNEMQSGDYDHLLATAMRWVDVR